MAKILIIGGGVAGLSAGIYAQLNGHQAVVCEKHSIPGGNLTGWQRGEYHIDNCIHWLTGTNPASRFYSMWNDLGALGDVEVMQGESLYTCEADGVTLGLYTDLERIRREMLAISPEDKKEIDSLIRAVKIMQRVDGIGGKNNDQKMSIGQLISGFPTLLKFYSLTTGQLAKRFKHPLLSSFITAFWGEDFGAFALIVVFSTFCGKNGGIPRGSSCAMAERMAQRLQALGGELLLKKQAVKVNRKNGSAKSVTFADGEEISADYVVLTCDPDAAFGQILDVPMPRALRNNYKNYHSRRFSSYHCAFACDSAELPFDGDFIIDIPEECRSVLPAKQVIIREFSHEPDFAPRGKNLLQTLTFCFEQESKKFIELKQNAKELYKKRKESIAAAQMKLITDRFPQLAGKLSCIDVWTPATYRRYTASEVGSYMSFALPSKLFPMRISNRIRGLDNVLLATQWQLLPGGLPIAAECGQKTIETIVKMEKSRRRRVSAGC